MCSSAYVREDSRDSTLILKCMMPIGSKYVAQCISLHFWSVYEVNELPVFGKIKKHFSIMKTWFIWSCRFATHCYNNHYHGCSIQLAHPSCFVVKTQGELVDFNPFNVLMNLSTSDCCEYVAPRRVVSVVSFG